MIKRFIFAILAVIGISAIVAFLFSTGSWMSLARWFVGTFVAQFVLQYIVTAILDAKYAMRLKEYERDVALNLAKTTQTIVCPCHLKHAQSVQVQFDEPIKYKCSQCYKDLSAYLEITSAMATVPTDNKQGFNDNLAKMSAEIAKTEPPK